jgi:hypothetical protein
MKIIHKITKQEAIEAYRQLNQVSEEITVEIDNDSTTFITGSGGLTIHEYPKAVPMPLYTPPNYIPPTTYC